MKHKMQVADAVQLYRFGILHLAEQTQLWYAKRLKPFSAWCSSEQLELEQLRTVDIRRYIHFQQVREVDGKRLASATVHGHARAVRAFLNWCSREDGLEQLVSEKVAKRIGMPHLEEKIIETFTDEQIQALFVACDCEFQPRLRWRDRAILSVLLDTGIRAEELCRLTLENCVLKPEQAFIRVHGKGDKWREVGLGNTARKLLHRYIMMYRKAPQQERHVFLSRFVKPLTVNGLGQITKRLGHWAKVSGVRCSPHTFRHTYACRSLLAGMDVFVLSLLMGHTSVTVTQRYLKAIKAQQARQISTSVLDSLGRKNHDRKQ